jgi:hypothetical protein
VSVIDPRPRYLAAALAAAVGRWAWTDRVMCTIHMCHMWHLHANNRMQLLHACAAFGLICINFSHELSCCRTCPVGLRR